MMDTIAIHRLAMTLAAAGGGCVPPQAIASRDRESSEDRELARAFAAGDAIAAQNVVDTHQDAIALLVHRMLGWSCDDSVEDIVQDVFVRALVARGRFNGKATLKTWLTRIAINECRAHFRKTGRRQLLLRVWH
ncbi:MAG: RNA polymerase sigma factor, partial [Aeoliella sp.]